MASIITGGVHAPRAVLATAQEFPDVARSMAEYIWNSLDYKRDKTRQATVVIRFGKNADGRWYEVSDFENGAGMDLDGLQRYFTMNAPNENRLRGELVRGRNGTGKAAAFGVGAVLEVYSVKDGRANEVILRKAELERLGTVYPCDTLPLEHPQTNVPVHPDDPQYGTRIRVTGIKQDFDETAVVRSLTRIFQRVLDHNELLWQKTATDLRRVTKPRHSTILSQSYNSPAELHPWIGDVNLTLYAAEVDLQRQESGIIVTSVGGNVMEDNYLNTARRRSIADKRIFGDIDVPKLDEPDEFGHHATTQARRLEMNRECERVKKLLPWLDACLDDFRERIEEILQSSAEEKDKAVLTAIAGSLERVLNQQYKRFMNEFTTKMKLPKLTAVGPFPDSKTDNSGGPEPAAEGEPVYVLKPEGATPVVRDPNGNVDIAGPGSNEGEGGRGPGTTGTEKGRVEESGEPSEKQRRGPRKAKAGASLQVAHVGVGATSPRAYYDGEGTFTINIDHPDFEGLEKTSPEFIRRCAEAVAVTYAQAIVEMRAREDPTVRTPVDAMNAFLDEHDKVLRPLIEIAAVI